MKTSSLILLTLSASMILVSGCMTDQRVGPVSSSTDAAIPVSIQTSSSLTKDQITMLVYLVQEEKLARDVYTVMYQTRDVKQFGNILNAEENHQQSVANILQRYSISNPIFNTNPGEFVDTELQDLYTTLIAQGKQSESEAIAVGIAIEEKDIKDIQDMMVLFDTYPDITAVLERLLAGSYNHLAAFQKRL